MEPGIFNLPGKFENLAGFLEPGRVLSEWPVGVWVRFRVRVELDCGWIGLRLGLGWVGFGLDWVGVECRLGCNSCT